MASSAASRSTSRWERTGEPATTFSGLGRPGRGGRGRGGHRGGRGAGRGNPRESKASNEDNIAPPKQDPSPLTTNPSATSSTQQLPATISDQTSASLVSSSKPKPSSRKPSRVIPSPLNVQVTTVQVTGPQTPSPSSARTPNRRRRSQAGKPNGNNPPKANATVPKDTKSNKSRLESAPATSVTPQLPNRLDVRQDIDALVERVRAVAMDNRPATPGSHIDWAGDDDDSLPDLNDWGVNTSTFASTGSESISPIILEGLKPLPDIAAPVTASPLRQVVTLDRNSGHNPAKEDLMPRLTPSRSDDAPLTTTNTPIVLKTAPEQASEQPSLPKPSFVKVENSKPPASNRRPWHPSLPAKPAVSSVVPLNLRPVATPMRPHLYPKSPTNKEPPPPKFSANNNAPVQIITAGTDAALDTKSIDPVPLVDMVYAQEKKTLQKDQDQIVESKSVGTNSDRSKSRPQWNNDDNIVEGLEASIHAPKAEPILTSAPVELSNYSHSQPSTIPQNRYWNNAKDQPPGRFYPQPRSTNGDHQSRPARSTAGRGGSHGRNHSAPNVGSPNSHQRIHGSRPVITGDALSRIARTIVNTSTTT